MLFNRRYEYRPSENEGKGEWDISSTAPKMDYPNITSNPDITRERLVIAGSEEKENDVFPQTLESWIYLLIACFIGIFIGQWIRNRRNKTVAGSEPITRMENTHQRKRISKKARLKGRRLLK